MRSIVQNYSASVVRNGNTFSDEFLRQLWTGMYRSVLRYMHPSYSIWFLDPFGKWPTSEGGPPETLIDQWNRCRLHRHPDEKPEEAGYLVSLIAQFMILQRLPNMMVFKIGYDEETMSPYDWHCAMYPFVALDIARQRLGRGGTISICFDGASALAAANRSRYSMLADFVRGLNFEFVSEGLVPDGADPISEETLVGWQELHIRGGAPVLEKYRGGIVHVLWQPEYGMTEADANDIERFGHSVLYTPETLPIDDGGR